MNKNTLYTYMHNCEKVWQSVFVCEKMLLYPWLFDSKMKYILNRNLLEDTYADDCLWRCRKQHL